MKRISVVVPCYNEESVLNLFYDEIVKTFGPMEEVMLELVFVDDGSSDNTLKILKELAVKDKRVLYLSFSRNFGKEAGIYAGLKNASGDFVVVMDADLQHPPKMLLEMYEYLRNDEYDIVGCRRVSRRGEPPIRSFFARMFYKIINKMADTEFVDGATDFQMMSRKVVDAVLSMKEYNRFTKGIFSWVGFHKKWIEYENVERAAGETKWSFGKMVVYALEGIVAFSTTPLVLASVLGIVCCCIAAILVIYIVVKTIIFGDPTPGWPSLACLFLFISGIQLFFMGVLGQYLAKTYLETKKRPIYIAKETNVEKRDLNDNNN